MRNKAISIIVILTVCMGILSKYIQYQTKVFPFDYVELSLLRTTLIQPLFYLLVGYDIGVIMSPSIQKTVFKQIIQKFIAALSIAFLVLHVIVRLAFYVPQLSPIRNLLGSFAFNCLVEEPQLLTLVGLALCCCFIWKRRPKEKKL